MIGLQVRALPGAIKFYSRRTEILSMHRPLLAGFRARFSQRRFKTCSIIELIAIDSERQHIGRYTHEETRK